MELKTGPGPGLQFHPGHHKDLCAVKPLRDMLTPAMAVLLLFRICSGILVAPLLTLFPVYVEKQLHLTPVFSAGIRVLSVVSGGLVALVGGAVCDALGRKPAYLLAMTGVISAGMIFFLRSPAL